MEISKNVIDPWGKVEVKNYDKLMKELGIDSFKNILKSVPKPMLYMKRGIIYGHKDFDRIITAIKKKEKFVMLTGLMPSGKFHFGHKIIADQIIYYQSLGAECYILSADIEAYLTRNIPIEEGRKIAIDEYLANYIALGLKPKNVKFFFQSEGSKSYMNFSKFISKKMTFNEIRAIYGNDVTPGKMISALTQIADILYPQFKENGGPKATVVPVGFDQLPHINFTRDIASKFKSYNFILPSATFNKFMPGLQGGKMSSSNPMSYIALTDDPDAIRKKVMKYAFSGGQATVQEHRKRGGNPDIDVSYQWLTFLEESDKKLQKIYNSYKSGKLLTGELKEILIEKLIRFLKQHQIKRKKAEKLVNMFLK